MLKRFSLYFIIAVSVFSGSGSAQTSESSSALMAMKNKTSMHKLANGLRVIMYNRGVAPVFSGVVSVRVGGVDEKEGQTGVSHMFEHMAFKGTPTIGTKDYKKERELLQKLESIATKYKINSALPPEIKEEWQRLTDELSKLWVSEEFVKMYRIYGAQDLNATTGKELTNYMVSLPKSAFEFWCWMESERLFHPVMRQFYQERDVVMEERRMRYDDSPDGKLYELLLNSAYSIHPFRNPVIGYPHDISNLTATDTKKFREKYYVPSNIVISVVGSVDVAADLPVIEKYFGRLEIGPSPEKVSVVEPAQEGEKTVTFESKSAPQSFIAYHKPHYPNPDDPAINIMSTMLAGVRSSPLYRRLVEKERILTGIDTEETPGEAFPNLLVFYGTVRAPHTNDDFIRAFDEEIVKFKSNPVSAELLDIAKRNTAMSYIGHLESNMSLALGFASAELLHGGWEAIIDWYTRAMAVTTDDVSRVANQYLNATNRTIARLETKAK